MQITVGELDKHGGFWVTVKGGPEDKQGGAGARANKAAKAFGAENGYGEVTRVTTGLSAENGDWEYTARYEVENKPTGPEPYSFQGRSDWATDELAQIIADADSRCQAQPIHRMRGTLAVGEITVNGRTVKACEACIDHYAPKTGKLH